MKTDDWKEVYRGREGITAPEKDITDLLGRLRCLCQDLEALVMPPDSRTPTGEGADANQGT